MTHPHTQSREIALQYLYMHDLLEGKEVQPLSDYLGMQQPALGPETVTFARRLVESVLARHAELDAVITAAATNWTLSRMAIVDRNILRLGLAELMDLPETPFKVVINEGVELARRFSSVAACAFVNGLLDKMHANLRPAEPQPPGVVPSP